MRAPCADHSQLGRPGRYDQAVSDAAEVFGRIYDTDHWQGGSGPGSTSDATEYYRMIVRRLLASRQIRSVVDIGCGDWQVGSLIDWTGVNYTGIDVVSSVIERNQQMFGSERVKFAHLDVRTATLPCADLLIVKDVLQHWPTSDVLRFVHSELSRFRFALLTNDIASRDYGGPVNEDIEIGAWRTLDLEASPFTLTARARWTYEVGGGRWTKRVLLLANSCNWILGEAVPRSMRRIARSIV